MHLNEPPPDQHPPLYVTMATQANTIYHIIASTRDTVYY
jgi:hypothetical protein